MATYVNDLRLTELATGEGSGTWGVTTNTNLELIGEALGYGTQDCFATDADATTTVADGATDPARAMYFKVTSSATLTATRILTIGPNTVSRVMFIENATTGSQSIEISQGSGGNVTIAAGKTAVVYLDGAGAGAAVVDAMALVDPGVTDTLAEVLAAGNATGGTDIAVGTGDDITFADSSKAIFGAGSDLEIYHSGTHSIINETGTGELKIQATNLRLQSASGGENYLTADLNGAVRVYYDDAQKFQTTATGIDVTGNATFADNGKAIFGAGSDLQIYHDGSNSYISEAGTGNLIIGAGAGVLIKNKDLDENLLSAYQNGAVELFYDNAEKLTTTATGIDVTGTVTADGADINAGTGYSASTQTIAEFRGGDNSNNTYGAIEIGHSAGDRGLKISAGRGAAVGEGYISVIDAAGTAVNAIRIKEGGDISFYEDTGTTPKFFWDASEESLRVPLALYNNSINAFPSTGYAAIYSTGTGGSAPFNEAGHLVLQARSSGALRDIIFATGNGAAERMRIDSSGNVGIGTTSPARALHVVSTSRPAEFGSDNAVNVVKLYNSATGSGVYNGLDFVVNSTANSQINTYGMPLTFGTSASNGTNVTERARIDSSGNLLVGKSTSDVGATDGFEWYDTANVLTLTRTTGNALSVNRLSTDGAIVTFRKDGTTVGSIASRAGAVSSIVLDPRASGCGLGATAGALAPSDESGALSDNASDLGTSSNRFKDLYLSGRVIADGVTTSAHAWSSESDSTSSSVHLYFRNPNGFVGNISTSGTATAYNTSSDYRLKENVVSMSGATERLKQLKPSRFNFIADPDTTVDGFLAHEVQDIVPEAITGTKDAVDAEGNPKYQGIDQSKLVPLLVATIQELEARIAALEGA